VDEISFTEILPTRSGTIHESSRKAGPLLSYQPGRQAAQTGKCNPKPSFVEDSHCRHPFSQVDRWEFVRSASAAYHDTAAIIAVPVAVVQ
jgi:hypothetical protein